jgi:deferrochelatase/peroxidase EfeB
MSLRHLSGLAEDTWVLPLLDASLVGESHALLPRSGPGGAFPSSPTPLAAQVAAPSYEALVHALRKVEAAVAGAGVLHDELLGGKLGEGREPFGFRDGLWVPTPEEVRAVARYVTQAAGGQGAVRELCDLLLVASGRYAQLLERYS